MKQRGDGLPIGEEEIKLIEGLEALAQAPWLMQRTILFQLAEEIRERIFELVQDASTFFAKNPRTILRCPARGRRNGCWRKRRP